MTFQSWLRNRQSTWQLLSRPGNARRAAFTRRAVGYRPHLELLEDRLCPSALPPGPLLTPADAATQARVSQVYGQLPLSFETNHGQTNPTVDFLSRGSGYTLFLTPTEAVLALQKSDSASGTDAHRTADDVLRMDLIGANARAPATGLDAQAGLSNYFLGNDPTQWHTRITNYGQVEYQNVYAGVNLVYYGSQRQLEYDFIVAPGANPGVITLAFQGAKDMTLDAQGNLVLHTAGGDMVQHAPVLYQDIGGVRQTVAGRYVLYESHQVGFAVGAYDFSQALIIDPVLSYSTYLGGSGYDQAYSIAVDSSGNAFVTGSTDSTSFPTKNPLQAANLGTWEAFVSELNATGTALVYSTYLGGSGFDRASAIALDGAGNAYVTGRTTSTDFPTKNPLQPAYKGGTDAFVTKLNATGTGLVYSTYLGGSSDDEALGIAVDGASNAYVTGKTNSTNFPGKNPLQAINRGNSDAFVAKLNATGTALAYSTYVGGSGNDIGQGIAVDSAGNAYIAGYTSSNDFPTKHPLQAALGGFNDAFVAKLNATGTALAYSTYLGGSYDDRAFGIAVDGAGNAYVTGQTPSTNFPTKNPFQGALGGYFAQNAFVAKLNAMGTALVYSTFLGGGGDRGTGIAVDLLGNAYVTGITTSTNFPTKNPLQAANGGGQDAFVAELNAMGTALVYSTYLGGSSIDNVFGIAVNSAGDAYVAGTTNSTDFPTKNPLQAVHGGGIQDAFVARITLPGAAASASLHSTPSNVACPSSNMAISYSGTIFSSSDGSASNYTFTPAEGGLHHFVKKRSFERKGSKTVTVTDTLNRARTGSDLIEVV